jgi:hypothetical protein
MAGKINLIKIIAVSLVVLFIVSGFSVMFFDLPSSGIDGHNYSTAANVNLKALNNYLSLSTNSSGASSNQPYVKYTIFLNNNTLTNGAKNWSNDSLKTSPISITSTVASKYYVFVGITPQVPSSAGSIYVINTTTNQIVNKVLLTNVTPSSLFYDQFNNYLYVGNGQEFSDEVDVYSVSSLLISTIIYHPIQVLITGNTEQSISLNPSNGNLYIAGESNVLVVTPSGNVTYINFKVPLYFSSGILYDTSNKLLYDWLSYYHLNSTTGIQTPMTLIRIMNTTNNTFYDYVTLNDSHITSILVDPFNNYLYLVNETTYSNNYETVNILIVDPSDVQIVSIFQLKMASSSYNYFLQGLNLVYNPIVESFYSVYSMERIQRTSSNSFFGLYTDVNITAIDPNNNSLSYTDTLDNYTSANSGNAVGFVGITYVAQNGYLYTLMTGSQIFIIQTEKTYYVNFSESGLPTNATWYVKVNNFDYYGIGSNNTLAFPNGTYTYTVGIYQGYSSSPHSGTITVDGTSVSQSITFSEVTYSVTFTESGLPAGTTWNITLNDVKQTSSTSSITFKETNGTYSYIVGIYQGYLSIPHSGNITVNGASVSQSVTFTQKTYPVTFTENGLPAGTLWFVNLSNGQSFSYSKNTIIFQEPNGTYTYTIATNNKEYTLSQYSGSFNVSGASVSESITFNLVTYKITFTESGLPAGTTWNVTLNGVKEPSSSYSMTFSEPNGSYSYTVQMVSGYRTTTYSGAITINGNPVNENIIWSEILYPMTIIQTGMPNGTAWSVTLMGRAFNGQSVNVTLSSTNSTITFNEPNGTYSYVIHLPSGYTSSNSKGSLNVSGASVTSPIAAKQVSIISSDYIIYAIVAVVIVIAVVGAILAMNRKKK